jgi:acyl-CoA thioesterase-1
LAKRYSIYGALLLFVQLVAACTGANDREETANASGTLGTATPIPAATPAADSKLVVAFGDSLYAGYNLAPDQGFAPALQRALLASGVQASVFNAGVSGDTSAAGLQRLAFTLDGLPRKPDLLILGLGGNDMLRGLSPETTRANLDAILAELRKREIPVILTGMIAAPNMGPDYASAFNPIYADLAKKYGAGLYPFFLDGVITDRALLLPDGIHPSDGGVRVIVERITPLIAARLKP